MNTPGRTDGGRFTGVEYFNGGLFAEIDPVELKNNELYALEAAAKVSFKAMLTSNESQPSNLAQNHADDG